MDKVFEKINNKNPMIHLEFFSKYANQSLDYKLEEIN